MQFFGKTFKHYNSFAFFASVILMKGIREQKYFIAANFLPLTHLFLSNQTKLDLNNL